MTESRAASAPSFPFRRSAWQLLSALPRSARRFWILVVATGAISGASAALLVQVLRLVQKLAWGAGSSDFLSAVTTSHLPRRLLVPVLGGALVVMVSAALRQPLRGHGTAGIIEAIWTRSGRMPLPRTLARGFVSILGVALGAPLGREGALLQTGAATGSWLGQRLKLGPEQVRLLVACGASAGIAAAYNVPIGAALFGLEVLLGSFALELFGPIVVSCVVATLVSRVLIADHPSYLIPHYRLASPLEMLPVLVFGVVMGAASALYVRTINAFATVLEPAPRRTAVWLPLVAMALVGAGAVWYPQLLGNGYDAVNAALLNRLPLLLLLVLPALKLVATSACAGAGVPGGLFTPSLFFGALLGGAFGQLLQTVAPGAASPGTYALLGMGAILAGTTHASVSALLMIFEMTGDYGLILPLMLASVLAAAVSRRLEPDSLYTSVLRKRNVPIPVASQPQWLRDTSMRTLLRPEVERVALDTKFEEIILRLLELPAGCDLYVTDAGGKYRGVIVLDALKGHIPDHSLLSMTVAADVMDASVPALRPDASLSEAAARFSNTTLDKLPVVGRAGELLGAVSRQDVWRHGRF